jgi:formyl-CoA transferase/CoA:oxalate CoA-transferase
LPLSGVSVLDLSRILAGPFCTMRLGDLGAEVIKIEQPGIGDETRRWGPPFIKGESAYYLSINRNKKSLTLDFKSARGRSILKKLIRQSDVLVENFRVGVLKKFGLDYPSVKRINPKIIYCSITGYGQQSTKSRKPSYDLIIQGESGLMDITGFPGNPPTKAGISIADINAGTVALSAILAALYARSQTGKGAYIDISLLNSTLSLLTFQSQIALSSSNNVTRKGNLHPTLAPYQTFRVKDGYMNIAVVNDSVWKSFCKALNNRTLARDKRFNTNAGRVQHHSKLEELLRPLLRTKSRKQWERIFSVADVPMGMIQSVPDALKMENKMLIDVLHPVIGKLAMVSDAFGLPKKPFTHPPLLGEHTNKILRTLGYSRAQLARLRLRKIV